MNIKHKNIIYGVIATISALIVVTVLFKITETPVPFTNENSYSVKYDNGVNTITKTVTYYNNDSQETQSKYIAKSGVISDIQTTSVVVKSGTSLAISGMVEGNVKVESGANVNVSGTVNGNIDIASGASAYISGIVNGNVNNSGDTEIYGMINGRAVNNGGNLYIDPNASVQGH